MKALDIDDGLWITTFENYGMLSSPEWEGSFIDNHETNVVLILTFPDGVNHVIENMSRMLLSEEASDITFIVKGEKIHAHKNILFATSPVMAMFQKHNFKERCSSTVEIDDIDSQVFRQLLRYMYTGTAPQLEEDSMTEPLFLAADKYQVEGLKLSCVNRLISKLSLENAVRYLVMGYLHSVSELQQASLECLKRHKEAVWDRLEWNELMKSYQDLFFQTCQQMFSNSSKN
jgi:speckle-type POZ protein